MLILLRNLAVASERGLQTQNTPFPKTYYRTFVRVGIRENPFLLFLTLGFAVSCARGPDFKTPPENISSIPGSGYAPIIRGPKTDSNWKRCPLFWRSKWRGVHYFDVQTGQVSTFLTFKVDPVHFFDEKSGQCHVKRLMGVHFLGLDILKGGFTCFYCSTTLGDSSWGPSSVDLEGFQKWKRQTYSFSLRDVHFLWTATRNTSPRTG